MYWVHIVKFLHWKWRNILVLLFGWILMRRIKLLDFLRCHVCCAILGIFKESSVSIITKTWKNRRFSWENPQKTDHSLASSFNFLIFFENRGYMYQNWFFDCFQNRWLIGRVYAWVDHRRVSVTRSKNHPILHQNSLAIFFWSKRETKKILNFKKWSNFWNFQLPIFFNKKTKKNS
jgi:hypothetical protein